MPVNACGTAIGATDGLAAAVGSPLEPYPFGLKQKWALAFGLSMIFSENRFPLFGIMR
jgi:hypothetical protein